MLKDLDPDIVREIDAVPEIVREIEIHTVPETVRETDRVKEVDREREGVPVGDPRTPTGSHGLIKKIKNRINMVVCL